MIYVELPSDHVGISYKDHSVMLEHGVKECTKNVTDTSLATLQASRDQAVSDLLDDGFMPATGGICSGFHF